MVSVGCFKPAVVLLFEGCGCGVFKGGLLPGVLMDGDVICF